MVALIIRRILGAILVMLVVSVCVFSLARFAPGDPAAAILGNYASTNELNALRSQLGLDRALPIQYVAWLGRATQGDLGISVFSGLPVIELFRQRIEPTLIIAVAVILLSSLIAVPAGIVAAWKKGGVADRIILLIATAGFSTPVFVTAYLLIYAFALGLHWLPTSGYVSIFEDPVGTARTLAMPVLTVTLVFTAIIARITRTSMLEVLRSDYIRTARAKGVGTASLLFKHALRNASIPVVTTIGSAFAIVIGGVVVTESVYAIPGLGRLVVDAIARRDYPVIQGTILLFSAIYVVINLAIDISYTMLDPRIRG
ncbi:ABC transporter permease [Ensifer sp. YR511]|uniref:ABC transporter permease n=1 Tax=Ensifer sp. YR511 TaxID=1855294 RepID=UPI00088B1B24|nr:ABC transporter permease [Ensifer sp. YR511]SDN39407.1 peptide/nickel transport system permease protein [Ensifer sp. YR511]